MNWITYILVSDRSMHSDDTTTEKIFILIYSQFEITSVAKSL